MLLLLSINDKGINSFSTVISFTFPAVYWRNLGLKTVVNTSEDEAKAGIELALPQKERCKGTKYTGQQFASLGRDDTRAKCLDNRNNSCARPPGEPGPVPEDAVPVAQSPHAVGLRRWIGVWTEWAVGMKNTPILTGVSPSQGLAGVLGCVCAGRNTTNNQSSHRRTKLLHQQTQNSQTGGNASTGCTL